MGSTIAGLLKDPDVIEIRCNADGKIYADWFDRPSSWTGQRLGSDMATQVVCIVADAVDQIVGAAANRYILDAEFPGQGFRFHGDLPPWCPRRGVELQSEALILRRAIQRASQSVHGKMIQLREAGA
jgi:Flp pilus assembly CpaF family ATPase